MATKKAILDPKVRRALSLVGVLLLFMVALAVQSYIARIRDENTLATPVSEAADDRLVIVDGSTMIVEPEALGQTMAEWLKSPKGRTFIFELSDRSFEANSAVPTPITVTRIGQVSRLLQASPTLAVHIVRPANFGTSAVQRLDEQRAIRLRKDLVATGVVESHVTLERAAENSRPATGEHMYVLLTK